MIDASIIEVSATGEVCLGDRKTEVEHDESADGVGLEAALAFSRRTSTCKLQPRARLPTIMTENGIHLGMSVNKRSAHGAKRSEPDLGDGGNRVPDLP